LDSLVAATAYGRKHAIAVLNATGKRTVDHAGHKLCRAKRYDHEVQEALLVVWRAANRICSKRLKPFLPELVTLLEKREHLKLSESVRARLLSVSPATADRLLKAERQKLPRKYNTTKPGSILKRQIPIRTFSEWNDKRLGFLEADLVAHCGGCIRGQYLFTFTLTDIASGWTECRSLVKRGEDEVLEALKDVRVSLPFPLLGLDTDNGSEFINKGMLKYCKTEKVTFTRSREYRKNDQAHVEEKNGSIVRKLVGYDRYEGDEAARRLGFIYSLARLYINFFQPSMKLQSKQRLGARTKKNYDSAKTPYARILQSEDPTTRANIALQALFESLDPVLLLAQIESAQESLWELANVPAELGTTGDDMLRITAAKTSDKPKVRHKRRPRSPGRKHDWQTRKDPFESIWPEILQRLEGNPLLSAGRLIKHFHQKYPDIVTRSHTKTMQRRVKNWRLEHIRCPS
jgi:hypothetical protein